MSSVAPEDLKSRLKESYDAIAPTYNSWTAKNPPYRQTYLDKLLDLLPFLSDGHGNPAPAAVLELGCGAGVPVGERLLGFPSRFITLTANDISSTQLALGRKNLGTERITWIEGDMMALQFPDDAFDAIVGLYSLIHLPREEQDILLGRIVKWLKPGGCVLINFSAENTEVEIMEGWLAKEGWMFWSGWGADATLQKVKETGLEIVVGEVVEDEVDASFLWVIAKRPLVKA
jgi:ubiquinone/menaquinone biosynthesis C-methylase UbiE